MVVVTALSGAAAACGGHGDGDASDESRRVATIQRAADQMSQPPPATGTFESSLPGVAQWELHQTAGSGGAVIEGRDAKGALVTALSIADADPADPDERGVVFLPAPSLGLDLDTVRQALERDVRVSTTEPATPLRPANLTSSLIENESPKASSPLTTRCTAGLVVGGLGTYCSLYSGIAFVVTLISEGAASPITGPIFAVCAGATAGTAKSHPCTS
jgi:hypothetical protein